MYQSERYGKHALVAAKFLETLSSMYSARRKPVLGQVSQSSLNARLAGTNFTDQLRQ